MKKLLVLDKKNYDDSTDEILRNSVRGIIFINEKILLIEDNFGEVKIPGGGVEDGENDIQALCREVREETGYNVIADSIIPFGEIEEKRLSVNEPKIWHHFSRLYLCNVDYKQGLCEFTESEKKQGFRQVLYTLDEAIAKNKRMLNTDKNQAWNEREYKTLLLIREYISKQSGSFFLKQAVRP